MPKQGLSEIVVLLDRSGSMATIRKDMESGFDTFIDEQKKLPGEATLTLVQFDTDGIETVHEACPLSKVPALSFVPRGGTPLLDATATTIDRTGERLAKMPENERPERVLFMILTDGEENSSRQFKKEEVQKRIKHQQEHYGWQFLYLGANVDAFAEASSLGISAASAGAYTASPGGVKVAFAAASASMYRGRMGLSTDLTQEERDQLKAK